MFNSAPHLIYCNCASVPVLHFSSAYSTWNCPVPSPVSGYRTSLDGPATHSVLGSDRGEDSEPSASRRLKFGIENILYGTPSQSGRSATILISELHGFSCHFSAHFSHYLHLTLLHNTMNLLYTTSRYTGIPKRLKDIIPV